MRVQYADELRSAAAAVAACCLIAAGFASVPGTGASGHAPAPGISVNRALKGDRLGAATAEQGQKQSPTAGTFQVLPERTPVGCDRAFSPIADPAQAKIYKRCMV